MTLYNQNVDQSGILDLVRKKELSPPDPGDASFPFADTSEKSTEAAFASLKNVVAGNGAPWIVLPPLPAGSDDGANISAFLKKNNVVLLPGAVYTLKSPIVVTGLSRRKLIADDAILVGAMAQTGGNTNSLIYGIRILAPVASTSIAVTPEFGQNKMTLTDASSMFAGAQLEANVDGSSGAIRQYFTILAKAGAVVTLDEPILLPLVTSLAHTVFQVLNRPTDIEISCSGTLFSGSGDRAISITGGKRITIKGAATIDCSIPTNATTLSGGVELFACSESSVDDVYVNGWFGTANADVFDYGFRFISCVQTDGSNLQAVDCTVANLIVFDCTQCVFRKPEMYDSITALATGIAIGGTTAANPKGCLECDFYAIAAANFFNGWGMNISAATRCNFFGYHGDNEALLQYFGHAENLNFFGVTVESSPSGAASGFNQGVIGGDGAHSGGVTKGIVFDDLTLIDCGSTVGTFRSTAAFESSVTIRGFHQRNPTVPTTRGLQLSLFNASDFVFLSDVEIETCAAGAGCTDGAIILEGEIGAGASQKTFIQRANITLNAANDVAINHVSIGILSVAELRDVEVLNPGAVGGTSGYVGGTNTALRRYGRVNFSATATPVTANQSNRGTFNTNNATPVSVGFADINAQEQPKVWMFTAAGTPAPDQTIVVTAGTGFACTGKNLDTSVRAYEI